MAIKIKLLYTALLIIGSNHLFIYAIPRPMHGGVHCEIEKVPYLAQFTHNYYERGLKSFCGAAILSERWLLSASHCVQNGGDTFLFSQVRIGSSKTLGGGKLYNISKIIKHEKYSTETRWNNDISLIALAEPIQFNDKSQPISISKKSPRAGNVITIAGFGFDKCEPVWNLKMGHQKVISRKKCKEAYKNTPEGNVVINKRVFCTDSTVVDCGGGDSGSPAVLNGKVVGIIVEANDASLPNIYVAVSYYYDWISNVTGIKFD